jgi:hypothetical protein
MPVPKLEVCDRNLNCLFIAGLSCAFLINMLYVFNVILFQLLCLIGEAFEDLSDEICGAVINLRPKGDKLGLWTADATHADAIMKIGLVHLRIYCMVLMYLQGKV